MISLFDFKIVGHIQPQYIWKLYYDLQKSNFQEDAAKFKGATNDNV